MFIVGYGEVTIVETLFPRQPGHVTALKVSHMRI